MKKGFTLVEMLIAGAILALALSAFLAAFTGARRSAVLAENRMRAVQGARNEMERLMTLAYGEFEYGTYPLTWTSGFYKVMQNTNYPNSVKNIEVTVEWTNPGMAAASGITLYGSISRELDQ